MLIITIAAIGDGSLQAGLDMYLSNGIFALLVPLAVAVQTGLFRYHQSIMSGAKMPRLEKIGISSSTIPSATMLACCVCCIYPVSGILPSVGFLLAASSFLIQYKFVLMTIGLLANVIGSAILVYSILRCQKQGRPIVYSQLIQLG